MLGFIGCGEVYSLGITTRKGSGSMSSEAELKEIRSLLLKLYRKVDGLNELVEERLIGYEEPTEEDVRTIEEYESVKKN